ncbi:MAG TPA: L-lactate permease [Gaiellaceae bacterium]
MAVLAFQQTLEPAGGVVGSTLLALVPVATLLILLAVLRVTAWLAVIIGSVVTAVLALFVWDVPGKDAAAAYFYGSATGFWAVDWIVIWGVVIFNTLVVTGAFDRLKNWLVAQATADIRIQTILLAWAFGALLEGLVGFGYPWAVVAPILISLGVIELEAIRVAAIANNAPVSYGALGAPILGLSKVTGLDLMDLSSAIGRVVAILALLPPFILVYLVSGRRGLRTGWPIALAGALGYIAGQYPIAEFVGPYLPDVVGSVTAFATVFILIRFWRPSETLAFGGVPVEGPAPGAGVTPPPVTTPVPTSGGIRDAIYGLTPIAILVAVVVAWTGPWSSHYPPHSFWNGETVTSYTQFTATVTGTTAGGDETSAAFGWNPFVAGTAIFFSWLLILLFLRPSRAQIGDVFRRTFFQIWGAMVVGVFIFGLAFLFNFSGMAASMANGFSKVGDWFILLAPILGWIGVALSGSNTSTNTVFGYFQLQVGKLLGAPPLIFPTLNSIGAEVGKPIAPQTASVGVSTTKYVRNEGTVIRHNMPWTLFILAYLIGIGALYYFVFPDAMKP